MTHVRVLIADPDPGLRDKYRNYLRRFGFEVATVSNGLECVAALRELRPDVLVLEPTMPWGGGEGVLALMHEELEMPMVPVIVVTNRPAGVHRRRVGNFSIREYHKKPVTPECLLERVRFLGSEGSRRGRNGDASGKSHRMIARRASRTCEVAEDRFGPSF